MLPLKKCFLKRAILDNCKPSLYCQPRNTTQQRGKGPTEIPADCQAQFNLWEKPSQLVTGIQLTDISWWVQQWKEKSPEILLPDSMECLAVVGMYYRAWSSVPALGNTLMHGRGLVRKDAARECLVPLLGAEGSLALPSGAVLQAWHCVAQFRSQWTREQTWSIMKDEQRSIIRIFVATLWRQVIKSWSDGKKGKLRTIDGQLLNIDFQCGQSLWPQAAEDALLH